MACGIRVYPVSSYNEKGESFNIKILHVVHKNTKEKTNEMKKMKRKIIHSNKFTKHKIQHAIRALIGT